MCESYGDSPRNVFPIKEATNPWREELQRIIFTITAVLYEQICSLSNIVFNYLTRPINYVVSDLKLIANGEIYTRYIHEVRCLFFFCLGRFHINKQRNCTVPFA